MYAIRSYYGFGKGAKFFFSLKVAQCLHHDIRKGREYMHTAGELFESAFSADDINDFLDQDA